MSFSESLKRNHQLLSQADFEFRNYAERDPRCQTLEAFAPWLEAASIWDYAAQPWPTFGSPELVGKAEELCLSFDRLVKGLFLRIFENDFSRIADFYNIDHDLTKLTFMEPSGLGAAVTRMDCLLTEGGFQVLEINGGSFMGGWAFLALGGHILSSPPVADFLRENHLRIQVRPSVGLMLAHMLKQAMTLPDFRGRELNLVFTMPDAMDQKTMATYTKLYREVFQQTLAQTAPGVRGRCMLCKTDALKTVGSKLYFKGVQIHALFEQHAHLRPIDAFRCAKAGTLALFSGPVSLFLNDKRNLALLSDPDYRSFFDSNEQEFLAKHLPWTRITTAKHTTYRKQNVYLPDFLIQERTRLVLKDAKSYGGYGVVVGRTTPPQVWAQKVTEAFRSEKWVVQEFLEAPSFLFPNQEGQVVPQHLVWGIYAIDQALGGIMLRTMPRDVSDIVNAKQGATPSVLLELLPQD